MDASKQERVAPAPDTAGPVPGSRRRRAGRSRPDLPQELHRIGRVHHVAIVVRSIDSALTFYRDLLGLDLETVMDIPSDRVRIAFLDVGGSKIELVEPTDDKTGVARFLDKSGEGFHHVCFEVGDLTEELTRLGIEGVELIDSAPRRGAEGPVAFIHPRSCHGVLVELIEAQGGPSWRALGYPAEAASPVLVAAPVAPAGAPSPTPARAVSRKRG
jgi:methylmalonyl-CoA epimerase